MKETFAAVLVCLTFISGWFLHGYFLKLNPTSMTNLSPTPVPRPYEKYSIENMSQTDIKPGKLKILQKITEENEYTSYLFEYEFNPSINGSDLKKTTGQINVPKISGPHPAILMLRGYINQKTFKTGDGTRNASKVFAKNGFLTIAPDFLGYGGSDPEAGNIFEARFQTYVTAISLLRNIEQLSNHPGIITSDIEDIPPFNINSIFIWGHSNGGQIGLTLLEETGVTYPTVLWAPVSKPFPYSVLYYTDVSDDHGKLIRHELSDFEALYDAEKYSLSNYLDKIKAPIQLNQGTIDDAVPISWSNTLNNNLKSLGKDIKYNVYPGTDHDMKPLWNDAVLNSINFYNSFLVK